MITPFTVTWLEMCTFSNNPATRAVAANLRSDGTHRHDAPIDFIAIPFIRFNETSTRLYGPTPNAVRTRPTTKAAATIGLTNDGGCDMLYEVRDYHYRRDLWDDYEKWATEEAFPYLKANLDIVGSWIDSGVAPQPGGTDPDVSKHGDANVTWIIRWADKETRDQEFATVMGSDEWKSIWSRHPDANGYLQVSVRFMTQI